jgi:pimeloyl-ACP methyl ester carboxylesterase
MATTSTSTAIAAVEPVFTEPEQLALAGLLAGYTGLTREAFSLDLRQYASWCQQRHLRLFQARRADIECFARAALASVSAPALVIQGDRDEVTLEHGAAVAARLGDGRLAVLPGTHGLPIELPGLVNMLLISFLRAALR